MKVSYILKKYENFILINEDSIENLDKISIKRPGIYRSGLELSGWDQKKGKLKNVIVWGTKEARYFSSLEPEVLKRKLEKIASLEPPLIVLSGRFPMKYNLLFKKIFKKTPVAKSEFHVREIQGEIGALLAEYFAPHTTVHASLVKISGRGVLILGPSGIGKSEAILELLNMGHVFIADDAVYVWKVGRKIFGKSSPKIKGLLEARGLGIIDIPYIFGHKSFGDATTINLVVELVIDKKDQNFDRLGNHDLKYDILNMKLPRIRIPIVPGRSLGTLIQSSVFVYTAKLDGLDPLELIARRKP
ncbi:MAG: HPr(Ser) kinase/phosphatase [Mycoplasma sp.]|nr:HPr(Ser) kinase/phosphatase [Mycoplasma sp.]